LRASRGLTAEQLSAQMAALGVPFHTSVLANLETGRRRFVTVAELLALAVVLGVAPVHLLVPVDDEGDYAITPNVSVPAARARAFIRGTDPLDSDAKTYHMHVPTSELTAALFDLLRGRPDLKVMVDRAGNELSRGWLLAAIEGATRPGGDDGQR
jgi:transcriptional regulator with XRE-family HTH domain